MFSKILIPVSSEGFSEKAIERATQLVSFSNGKIFILYIIEEKMLDEVREVSDYAMTKETKQKLRKNIIEEREKIAKDVIIEKIDEIISNKNVELEIEPIQIGEFSDSISNFLKSGEVGLIFLGFKQRKFLEYRVIKRSNLPLWLYKKEKEDIKPLVVVSNLTVNDIATDSIFDLAKKFNLKKLDLKYAIDYSSEKRYERTKEGIKEKKESRKKIRKESKRFIEEFRQKCERNNITPDVEIIKDNMEDVAIEGARKHNSDLIIIGDIMKKDRLTLKENIDKKIVEKAPCSVLLAR
ncbi:hypothetical protein C9439_07210 [archaeon SCG-AAA382B04]|nr:hypothetical protein C9439_07210 [archaeon SCG-AAA382B04]